MRSVDSRRRLALEPGSPPLPASKICVSNITELPGGATVDKETSGSWGHGRLIVLPLVVAGKTIGALIFATVSTARNWPVETVQRLRMVEELFAGLLVQWRSEQALTEAERRYHAVADFMQDWEYWESPEGAILFCSPACERITGYGPHQFLAEPKLLHQIVLPEDASLWREFHQQAFAGASASAVCSSVSSRADGDIRWIEHHSRPVTDEKGNFLGCAPATGTTPRSNKPNWKVSACTRNSPGSPGSRRPITSRLHWPTSCGSPWPRS